MTATVDRATLRRLVAGWRPNMTVEVKVSVLVGLLDLLDRTAAELEKLIVENERMRGELRMRLVAAQE